MLFSVAVRWLSLAEFRSGEQQNPYAAEGAVRQQLAAVPESSYNFWVLGPTAYVISTILRRRRAVPGEVWLPTEVRRGRTGVRRLVRSLVVIDLVCLLLTAFGNDIAPLVLVVSLVLGIPLTEVASRRSGVRAWIDHRTGLVGVDDGLRRRRGTLPS